jgi:hypothetical protein
MVRLAVIIAINGVISGFAGWGVANLLDSFGVFGSGSQSGYERGLGMLFIGMPLSWLSIFILLMAMYGPRIDPAVGRWHVVGASALGFFILFAGFYVAILSTGY